MRLGERRLAAGILRGALGDNRTIPFHEAQARVLVTSLAQVVARIVPGGRRRAVLGEPAFAPHLGAKLGEQPRQSLRLDTDLVPVIGGRIAEA